MYIDILSSVIYVADRDNNRIQVLDLDTGAYLCELTHDRFTRPTSVYIIPNMKLLLISTHGDDGEVLLLELPDKASVDAAADKGGESAKIAGVIVASVPLGTGILL